jgi:CheY-like chemotaxis protein
MDSNLPLVLYAEDDVDDALLIHELFANHPRTGELVSVRDGEEAIAFLRKCSPGRMPSLIILDIHMPRLDGRETLVRLRSIPGLESVPVLLLTTSSFDLHPHFARQHRARFMTKPLQGYQLTELMQMLLADTGE